MPNHTAFRLNRSGMLLALISAAFAGEAAAATGGRVDFATPGATVAGTDGQPRPLAKGTEIGTGDTIRTDAVARAQIRFTDGSYVSLQPNTEFAIKDYNFAGKTDGSESGIFGLAKGAMRTVTGLIGRVNRNKYQITTPTATVGIRGTGGRIEVLLDGSTLIAGTSGIWVLSNPSGTLDIPAGTFGRAPAAPNQPPQRSAQGPNTGPAPLPVDPPKPLEPKGVEAKTDSSCQTNPTSAACISSVTSATILPPLVSGSGFAMGSAFFSNATEGSTVRGDTGVTTTFDSSGRLTAVNATSFQASLLPGGVHAEANNRDGLAWGRWIGPVQVCFGSCGTSDNYNANQGFHYVVGTPTAVMPTGSATVNYATLGATSPTFTDGSSTPGTFTLNKFTVNFATSAVNLNFDVKFGANGYNVDAPGTASGAQIAFTPTASGIGNLCTSSCAASVNGFFSGVKAERAGVAYRITDFSPFKEVVGAAAFKQVP
jgi:hypothetical protein